MTAQNQNRLLDWKPMLVLLVITALFLVLALELCFGLGSRAWTRWNGLWPGINALAPADHAEIDAQPAAYATLAGVELPAGTAFKLRVIGNPASMWYQDCQRSFARNPWDLAAFEGRIFIGLGDANNQGPSANAGPVPVYAYDPRTDRVLQETTLPEEQLDRFYRHNDQLWIPGDDPRQSWDWGNLYQRSASGDWRQLRTLPNTIHAYALTWQQDQLFAGVSITEAVPKGISNQRFGSAVAVSSDGGKHWDLIRLGGWRIFDFLTVQGRLYATDIFPGPDIQRWLDREQRQDFHSPVYEYDGVSAFQRRTDLTAAQLFPNTPEASARAALIQGALPWQDATLYLGLTSRAEDGAPIRGAYLARDFTPGAIDVERLPLPDNALAMDVRVDDGAMQILFAQALADQRWQSTLWTSRDARTWTEVLSFSAAAPARAVEALGGDWYFGLGSLKAPTPDNCTPADTATGTLLALSPL